MNHHEHHFEPCETTNEVHSRRLGGWGMALLFLVISLGLYWETLDDPFHFDDWHVFAERTGEELAAQCRTWNRVIPHLSFWLNYTLHGHQVKGYHLLNILVHWLTAVGIYLFLREWQLLQRRPSGVTPTLLIFEARKVNSVGVTPIPRNQGLEDWQTKIVRFINLPAFFAAVFFLVHPLATQSVAYVCQRYTSIATLFYVAALGFYLHARRLYIYESRIWALEHFQYYALAIAMAVGAMLSKEFAVTLPIVMVIVELTLSRGEFSHWRRRILYLLPFFVIGLIVPLMHFDFSAQGSLSSQPSALSSFADASFLPNWGVTEVTRAQYFFSQLSIIIRIYLKLVVFPIGQSIDHAFAIHNSLWRSPASWDALAILLLLVGAILIYRKSPLITLGIWWFFITLLPTSSLITNTEFVAEQRVYLPLIGGALVLVGILRTWPRLSLYLFTLVILTVLGVLTYQRNQVWADDMTLWQDATHKAPQKARPFFVLGEAYERVGKVADAIANYQQSLKNNPDYVLALNNLGGLYISLHHDKEAVPFLERAVQLDPRYAEAHYNLGLAYNNLNQLEKAATATQKALELRAFIYPQALYNLAMVEEKSGRYDQAHQHYKQLLQLDPHSSLIHYQLGRLCIREKKYEEAINWLCKAIDLNSSFVSSYRDLASILLEISNSEQSITIYHHYLSRIVFPDATLHAKLAEYFKDKQQVNEAISEYEKVVHLAPDNQHSREELIRLYLHNNDFDRARLCLQEAQKNGYLVADELRRSIEAMLPSSKP